MTYIRSTDLSQSNPGFYIASRRVIHPATQFLFAICRRDKRPADQENLCSERLDLESHASLHFHDKTELPK